MQENRDLRSFWSPKGVFSTRRVCVMGILLALAVVLTNFEIVLTPQFKLLTFTYLPSVFVSALFGPIAGIAFGFLSDLVTFIVRPMGPYFFGYALSAMVSCFIYALLLYRKPLKIWRVIVCRLLIMGIVILGLNAIWMRMLYGTSAGNFYTSARLIRNLIQFPFDVLLITFFLRIAQRKPWEKK